MRLSNMLVPLLSATSVGLVSAASTPEPQTAEIDLPKNLIVARYFGNDRFIGAGAILYGIGRCINFAPFEYVSPLPLS